MKSCVLWLGILLSLSLAAWGQDSASITGTVTDQSGAAVPNAQVTVSSPERGIVRPTTTNSSGDYLVAGLPSGSINVSVVAQGFKKYEVKGVILQVGQKARADIALLVGAIKEEVTVEGTNVAQVETQSSDLTGTVDGKQITRLQLNGRDFAQLITLVPGVSNQSGQDEGTVGINGSVAFSVNGGRTEYNNWELDGGDNMDNGSNGTLNVYPSLEAIAEFKVLTSNYGAQYGRNGSGTVEVETKSGTNRFHGNAYEFLRNDAFNAFNYFDDPTAPKPGYKKNDFGYTIGGPIWKDKTFFFWSQEWRRDRVPGQVFSQFVPSDAERAGNFSDLCPNPTTSDFSDCPAVPGFLDGTGHTPDLTIVPAFQANAVVAQALLGMIPAANAGQPGAELFNDSPVQPTNWREELIRVDHNLTDKERVTFRYIHDSWSTVTATPLWTNQGSFPTIQTAFSGPGVSMVARLNSTFSPTLLNEFVASYTTDHIVLNNLGNWQRPSPFPMGDLFPGNGDGILPGINLSGGNAYGGGFGQDAGYIPNGPYNSNPTYSYRDNISKIIGKHNLQFGAYFVAAQKNELGGELAAGSIPGYLTFDSSNGLSSGNPFADLLLGTITSYGQQNTRLKYYNRYKILEPYFQDDWHVTSHLTLNLGLRLSLFGTYREKQQQAYNFDPAAYVQGDTFVDPDTGIVSGNLFNGIVQCGVASVPAGCMKGHLFNPAPRIGFAWDPRGNGKTAIRGGYGIFFEHGNGNESSTESLENSPPLAFASQQNNIQDYAALGGGAGSASPPFPLSVTAIPTKATWPYVQQWHFDVQHEVLPSTVVTVSYVGSKGTKLARETNLNQLRAVPLSQNPYKPGEPIDGGVDGLGNPIHDDCGTMTTPSGVPIVGQAALNLSVACGGSADPFRHFLGYSDIASVQNAASSTYHALQVSVRRSVGSLQVSGAYTYSHSIDDASDRFDASFVDSSNPSANRASSNFDERHIFTGSYIWDLPFFKAPGLANKILGGWGFSGIASLQSGTPFSAVSSGSSGSFTDNAGVGNGLASSGSRPDLIGDPRSGVVQPPMLQEGFGPLLYNPAAFALPRGLTFGDAGRNILNNPRRINFDMALSKRFVIRESMAFEFRAEAFNVFNHTQFGAISGDSGSGANAVNSDSNKFPSNNYLFTGTAHNARILQLSLKFVF